MLIAFSYRNPEALLLSVDDGIACNTRPLEESLAATGQSFATLFVKTMQWYGRVVQQAVAEIQLHIRDARCRINSTHIHLLDKGSAQLLDDIVVGA